MSARYEIEKEFSPFGYDKSDINMIQVIHYVLMKQFNYDLKEAIKTIADFIKRFEHVNMDYFHHNAGWTSACNIHYTVRLNGSLGDSVTWQVENGLRQTPDWAHRYERKIYWGANEEVDPSIYEDDEFIVARKPWWKIW